MAFPDCLGSAVTYLTLAPLFSVELLHKLQETYRLVFALLSLEIVNAREDSCFWGSARSEIFENLKVETLHSQILKS